MPDDFNKEVFSRNASKKIKDWLTFDQIFHQGKQGITGLFKDEEKSKYTFKISLDMNWIAEHEFAIMERLREVSDFCPYFVKPFGLIFEKIDAKVKKGKNPFEIKTKYPVRKAVLFEEYIDGMKFHKLIKYYEPRMNVFASIIKQILYAVTCAQMFTKFSHYDLHSDNILLRECVYDTVFLYVFDDSTHFLIPSHGYFPCIIDFGFSYIDSLDGKNISACLAHTEVGFTSDRFDWVSDPKLFLIQTLYEFKMYIEDENLYKKFENIVNNLFSSLSVDWESGWDKVKGEIPASDVVIKLMRNINTDSKICGDYAEHCVDIIQGLITLPLKNKSVRDLRKSYEVFSNEFIKLESNFSSITYGMYLLQKIVESASKVKLNYENGKEKEAVLQFNKDINVVMSEITNVYNARGVRYELMLCALFNFADCMEGVLFNTLDNKMKEKKKEYDKIPARSVLEILNIIYFNLEDDYKYTPDTNIVVMDVENRFSYNAKIDEATADKLNNTPYYQRSIVAYQNANYEIFEASDSNGSSRESPGLKEGSISDNGDNSNNCDSTEFETDSENSGYLSDDE